jgi:hypothetical protein
MRYLLTLHHFNDFGGIRGRKIEDCVQYGEGRNHSHKRLFVEPQMTIPVSVKNNPWRNRNEKNTGSPRWLWQSS